MIESAKLRLKTEMNQNKRNSYIQIIGEFLLQYVNANPDSAEKILNRGKTIRKSLNEMRRVAEKDKIDNCAVLTDQEGFEIVLRYFGIEAPRNTKNQTSYIQYTSKSSESKPSKNIDFDIKLEDLLV